MFQGAGCQFSHEGPRPKKKERCKFYLREYLYSGSGGHFKAAVDTPRSGDMFGSLVVCLPTQFTGGFHGLHFSVMLNMRCCQYY